MGGHLRNDASDQGLVSKTHQEHTQLNTKKTNNPVTEWAGDLHRPVSKEDILTAKGH